MSGIRNKMLDGLYKIYDCSTEGTEEGKRWEERVPSCIGLTKSSELI